MNPVEKLQAAIERLEELRADSAPGAWTTYRDEGSLGWYVNSSEHGRVLSTGYVGNNDSKSHADLIVTLHSTIPALLAILRDIAERYRKFPPASEPGWEPKAPSTVNALALATAILGES